ncbi:MAG TPA: DUF2231 domain-containing protein [Longimicrobiaceae bacterium]|nr:DUF2231 domain-containing protein [Longimicrobiaceae bacterium]
MEARVKVLGHPVHQMLIVLPLGTLTGAVLFDLCHLASGGEQWALVSYWLIALGVLSGLLAAVFGLADWTEIPAGTRARRVGAVHGLGNVAVVSLFALSWLLRRDAPTDPETLAIVLSLAGGGLSMLTGWLGGELVGRLGVGVDDGANLDAPSSLSGRPAHGSAGD